MLQYHYHCLRSGSPLCGVLGCPDWQNCYLRQLIDKEKIIKNDINNDNNKKEQQPVERLTKKYLHIFNLSRGFFWKRNLRRLLARVGLTASWLLFLLLELLLLLVIESDMASVNLLFRVLTNNDGLTRVEIHFYISRQCVDLIYIYFFIYIYIYICININVNVTTRYFQ